MPPMSPMPPMRPNESDDDSELSEVDVAEIESVALSDTPRSATHPVPSDSPEIDEDQVNRDKSPLECQTASVSSNTGPNGGLIDLDSQKSSEHEGDQTEYFTTTSESPNNTKLPIQSTQHQQEKPSTTETGPKNEPQNELKNEPSPLPSNGLKRKSFPSESPEKASTSPTAHRPHRQNPSTPMQPPAVVSERQSNGHHKSPSASRKVEEETARLREILLHVSVEATQAILREQWRNFLFTNAEDSHITFILRAGLKNVNANVLARIFKDSGVMKETLVEAVSSKQPIVAKVLKNASTNQISDLVPSKILDQCLSERLKNVPAKTLIRWLAEADRLGYSLDDILDENDETVIPKIPSRAQSHDDGDTEMKYDEPKHTEPPSLDPLLAEQQRNIALQKAHLEAQQHLLDDLRCPTCTYKFDTIRGYNFHRTKNICTKAQPPGLKFYCSNCAQGFTTKQGMLYHEKKRVCLGEEGEEDDVLIQEPYGRPNIISTSPRSQYFTDANNGLHIQRRLDDANIPVPARNIPRPPLHTPVVSKHISSIIASSPMEDGARQSPSELTPEKLAALEHALQMVDEKYAADQAAIPHDWPADKREARLISLKNGNASRKSQIRKSFGVTLRMREKDKEAKKRREVLGTNAPSGSVGETRFGDFRNLTPAGYSRSSQQMSPHPPNPTGVRMEMVHMRPASGFIPINAPPQQHHVYPPSQAPPAHQMLKSSVSPTHHGFLRSFPHPAPLISQPPGPVQHVSPYGRGTPEREYRGSEAQANKRMKRNSSAGAPSQTPGERSQHFGGPSDSVPMPTPTHGRSASISRLNSGVVGAGYEGFGVLVPDGDARPGSQGSSGLRGDGNANGNANGNGNGNATRPIKRVPVNALQRRWEALNGKGPGRETGAAASAAVPVPVPAEPMTGVMLSVEGNGTGNESAEDADRDEDGDVTMEKGGKGKERERATGGMNIVDLVSEDESGGERELELESELAVTSADER
ncbi:hypothetical protein NHQ30_006836 [Ciborinia camelliae]|nr:hypothetical protein NHQ30_006836 [Ciborinia camelliae]